MEVWGYKWGERGKQMRRKGQANKEGGARKREGKGKEGKEGRGKEKGKKENERGINLEEKE